MSQKLNLVCYQTDSDENRFYEKGLKLISSVELPDSLLEALKTQFELKEKKIYMSIEPEKSFKIKHFDNEDVPKILQKFKESYKDLLLHESAKFHHIRESDIVDSNNLSIAIYDELLEETNGNIVDISIKIMRTFLDVLGIFAEKNEQYSDDNYIVLKVG